MIKEGWLGLVIQVLFIFVSIGSAYAAVCVKINYIEDKLKTRESDHDLLIALNQKVDTLIEEVKYFKADLRRTK